MDKAQQWKRGNEYAPPHVEAAYRDGWNACYEAAQAAIEQPVRPADSTPNLSVGDSSFEHWYQLNEQLYTSVKQLARDAYAAGMGDPLVTYAQPVQQDQRKLNGLTLAVWACAKPVGGATPEQMRDLLAQCVPYLRAATPIAQPVQPGYQRELDRFFRQVIYGDYMGDNPTDLSSALSAWAIVTTLVAQGKP